MGLELWLHKRLRERSEIVLIHCTGHTTMYELSRIRGKILKKFLDICKFINTFIYEIIDTMYIYISYRHVFRDQIMEVMHEPWR